MSSLYSQLRGRAAEVHQRWMLLLFDEIKTVVLTSFIWLALTIAFAALGVRALDWQEWHNLTRYGVETKGRVTGT